ncbi:hypothetical protein [Lelliottia sp. CFBP8978]|uniref:hypothetical protein n=1 Tax=Lelliottia sp. CFBP8978 TaxID=3096522 RepID=UPI002A6A52A0|nr:hypothetical protein [Lelliottia sp. CFBP8978]MDY1037382.1 hypothetical protein [Lelliottia sp. CFBP8978]
MVHYRISPPRSPSEDEPQAKAKYSLLNPAGSGDTMRSSDAFLCEPRAAFYTDMNGKLQSKIARLATPVRKNFHPCFQHSESTVKKNWKSGEEVT